MLNGITSGGWLAATRLSFVLGCLHLLVNVGTASASQAGIAKFFGWLATFDPDTPKFPYPDLKDQGQCIGADLCGFEGTKPHCVTWKHSDGNTSETCFRGVCNCPDARCYRPEEGESCKKSDGDCGDGRCLEKEGKDYECWHVCNPDHAPEDYWWPSNLQVRILREHGSCDVYKGPAKEGEIDTYTDLKLDAGIRLVSASGVFGGEDESNAGGAGRRRAAVKVTVNETAEKLRDFTYELTAKEDWAGVGGREEAGVREGEGGAVDEEEHGDDELPPRSDPPHV